MIVDVKCEDDSIQIADLLCDADDCNVEVQFLKKVKSNLYIFEDEITTIPRESIQGWYDVEKLEDTDLYVSVPGGYELIDDSEDEDYICSEEEDESESESLVDEDEA